MHRASAWFPFVALIVLAAPLVAEGQQAGKVPRMGWLGGPTRESAEPFVQAFQRGLKDLVAPSTPTALAAKNATKTIPIVTVAVGDPVGLGFVAGLARPGGNITGLTGVVTPEIAGPDDPALVPAAGGPGHQVILPRSRRLGARRRE
jgi:ABC transporter substrate binding protein